METLESLVRSIRQVMESTNAAVAVVTFESKEFKVKLEVTRPKKRTP